MGMLESELEPEPVYEFRASISTDVVLPSPSVLHKQNQNQEPRNLTAIIYVGLRTSLEIVFKSFNNICYGRSSCYSSIFHLRLHIVRALWCTRIGPRLC